MSRFSGNNDTCPGCGLVYKDLRTGLNYQGVFEMLWRASADSTQWKYKRRGTVLGLWHQIKQGAWAEHKRGCAPGGLTWSSDTN
jgi:hypothetical protein